MTRNYRMLAAIFLSVALLASCARGNVAPLPSASPEEAKAAVASYLDEKYAGSAVAPEKLNEITPDGVFNSTGFQLFSASNSAGDTGFLVYNNKAIADIIGFGGFGIASLEAANFDGRGNQVVYTYSWGSGLHRSILEVCDGDSGAYAVFADYSGMNMMLKKEKKNEFGVYEAIYSEMGQPPKQGEKLGTLRGERIDNGAYRLNYTQVNGNVHEVTVSDEKRDGE